MAGAIIDKHKRLNELPSPKLITVGGSNAMFGFNSPYMEQKLGIPVQNMSLAASLGLSFMLNEAKDDIKKGDIVLLSLEYFLGDGDNNIKLLLSELYPVSEKYIEYPSELERFKTKCNYIFRELRNYLLISILSSNSNDTDAVYGRSAFNKNGSIKEELRLTTKQHLSDGMALSKTDYYSSITKINAFIKEVESKGGTVFFSFPPVAESQFLKSPEVMEDLHKQYQKHLNAKIINKPTDSVYPDSCFYDTIYHLRSPYHTLHTDKVLKQLNQHLSAKNN